MSVEQPKFSQDWFEQKWSKLMPSSVAVFQDYYLLTLAQLSYKASKDESLNLSRNEIADGATRLSAIETGIRKKRIINQNYGLIFEQLDHDFQKLVVWIESNSEDKLRAIETAADVMRKMIDYEV